MAETKRNQINIRLDERTAERLPAVQDALRDAGMSGSIADIFRLGVVELERKYLKIKPIKACRK